MRIIGVAIGCGLGLLAASLVAGPPSAAADIGAVPGRVMLRGWGGISPAQGEACDADRCPGVLRVNLHAGMPGELHGLLDIAFTVSREIDPVTACRKLAGSGTLRDPEFVATIVGELCGDTAVRYSLNGSLQIFANTRVCANQSEPAAVGALEVFGAVKAPGNGNDVPFASSGLASFVGSAGRIVICGP